MEKTDGINLQVDYGKDRAALRELRRALSAEIDFDSRSRREVRELRNLTSDRTMSIVKRSVRRALLEGG